MATRRLAGALNRHFRSILPSTASAALATKTSRTLSLLSPDLPTIAARRVDPVIFASGRGFSSRASNSSGEDEDDDDDDDDDDEEDDEEDEVEVEDGERLSGPVSKYGSGKSAEEKALEAAEIGYKVIGPLDSSEKPFKPYEPVFAVVQIGSHQFKVSNGDSIFTERLKFCDVNDKLVLSKVLMLGSKTQTIIGRPILPEASVHAVVEEHALDAKVIIFKKKRRKNYRRTKGHRQELTKLRITDIQGMDKSENITVAA